MTAIDASSHRGRIRQVIATTFGLPEDALQGELKMGNPPQWDSLGHMTLVTALEGEFGVTFPAFQIAELSSEEKILAALDGAG